MNKSSRLVSAAILFFDCSRLLFMLTLLAAYAKPAELLKGGTFPFLLFVAPNALFPLISLFVFTHPQASGTYKPLYITGKSLSVLCMALWFLEQTAFPMVNFLIWTAFIGIADISTIVGMAVLGIGAIKDTSAAQTAASSINPEEAINKGGE
jgi:hypothetical protein